MDGWCGHDAPLTHEVLSWGPMAQLPPLRDGSRRGNQSQSLTVSMYILCCPRVYGPVLFVMLCVELMNLVVWFVGRNTIKVEECMTSEEWY